MEQVQYNLLYRWFIGLTMDDAVWVPTVFTKNRERLIAHDAVAQTAGDAVSQQRRQLIEQGFGWAKTVAMLRQVKVRGLAKVDQCFVLAMTCYNLVRMRTLGALRPRPACAQTVGIA